MILVSKSQIKLITSLQQKKYRNKTGLFVAEGSKVILELLAAKYKLHSLFATMENLFQEADVQLISNAAIQKISSLKNANNSLAVFEIPTTIPILENTLIVALDAVRDPGNLGTIIRLCDWFGVQQLICSLDTVDCYNPKVVQASMGSISRVNINYVALPEFIENHQLPIYGGCLEGNSIYSEKLENEAIIVLGNEANGISDEIRELLNHKVTIPRFGTLKETESLNVATATAILLNEFKRPIEK